MVVSSQYGHWLQVTGLRESGSASSCKTGYPHVGGGHGQGPLGTWQKDMLMWAGPL